jgi:hypothetical protein
MNRWPAGSGAAEKLDTTIPISQIVYYQAASQPKSPLLFKPFRRMNAVRSRLNVEIPAMLLSTIAGSRREPEQSVEPDERLCTKTATARSPLMPASDRIDIIRNTHNASARQRVQSRSCILMPSPVFSAYFLYFNAPCFHFLIPTIFHMVSRPFAHGILLFNLDPPELCKFFEHFILCLFRISLIWLLTALTSCQPVLIWYGRCTVHKVALSSFLWFSST